MTVQDAITEFRRKVARGQVFNARTGSPGPIDAGLADSIISNVACAFRAAAGTDNLGQIRYHTFAERLAEWAVADAEEHGLADASNRAARCRRFVRTIDRKAYQRRPKTKLALPCAWTPLGRVLLAEPEKGRRVPRSYSSLAEMASLLGPLGIRRPQDLPDKNELYEVLVDAGVKPRKAQRMIMAYRKAWGALDGIRVEAGFPDIDRCPVQHERGLRSLEDIAERLARAGCMTPPSSLPMEQIIELVAPVWHRALAVYLEEHAHRGPRWRKKRINASSRFLAELARTGRGDLAAAHPTRLLLERVETLDDGHDWEQDDWADDVLGDLDLEDEIEVPETDKPEVPLLEYLAESVAEVSAANSTLAVESGDGYWTETLIRDVQVVGELGLGAATTSKSLRQRPRLVRATELELGAFLKRMREENKKLGLSGYKAKEMLLKLATWPMLLFLGIPALRKRANLKRTAFCAELGETGDRRSASRIARAEQEYHDALRDYLVFAIMHADGLRLANYTHARLGTAERTPVQSTAAHGEVVESYTHIRPEISQGDITGVTTNFFGNDHPNVKLKIDRVAGSGEWRTRGHWLRRGLVDFELLMDYLTLFRPRNLEEQGLIPSATAYDLERDLAELHFALFVSPARSVEPYRAVTGAYSPQQIARIYARTLYWVTTVVLGRSLPEFGSEQFRADFPGVFGPHGARLQAGTYLNGMLRRSAQAQTFLNDTARTVERRYSVVEASMVMKRGWEEPTFFNALFERVWDREEAIDWDSEDPLSGLPDGQRPPGLEAVS